MPKFPHLVQRGSAVVRIRPYDNHGRSHFLITWHALGRRRRESRTSFQAAKDRAEAIATALANGKLDALELTGADRDSYRHARALLRPLGIPLHSAVEEFVAARRIAGGASLIEMAREHAERHAEKLHTGNVPELVEQCLAHKRADGLKERYLTQLRSDLRRFSAAFPTLVNSIGTAEIEEWLRSLEVGLRTRANLRTSVVTFFSFCRRHGFLAKNVPTEAEAVAHVKVPQTEVTVFTPAQLELLLNAAPDELIPFVAIGAFAV